MSTPHPLRHYIIGLYQRGLLATLEEGALIGGVSRRRVMAWLVAAKIDCARSRLAFIAKHRRRAVEQFEGKPVRRVTKRQQRANGIRAKRQWDRRKLTQ